MEKGKLNPSIVNVDTMWMSDKASSYVIDIMRLLNTIDSKILLILNMVIQYGNVRKEEPEDLFDKIVQKAGRRLEPWTPHKYYYLYDGKDDNSISKMCSIVLIKK